MGSISHWLPEGHGTNLTRSPPSCKFIAISHQTQSFRLGYFLDINIIDQDVRPIGADRGSAAGRSARQLAFPSRHASGRSPMTCRRARLAELVPRQSFSITALRRYDHKNWGSLSLQPKLAPEPGPQIVECRQPGWLFSVNPSAENDEDVVRSCCIAANHIAIRPVRRRFGNEDSARPALSRESLASLLPVCQQSQPKSAVEPGIRQPCDRRSSSLSSPGLPDCTASFQPSVSGSSREDEPSKRGRIAHVSHLAR